MNAAAAAFCTRFGVTVPIVNAPMAFVAGGALAGAVASAGGLGLVAGGYGDLDWVESQLALVGESTPGTSDRPGRPGSASGESAPVGSVVDEVTQLAHRRLASHLTAPTPEPEVGSVGVGVILWHLLDAPRFVDRLLDIGVRSFFVSFGDPAPLIARVHAGGGRVLHQVQSVDEGLAAIAAGTDAVVAQGHEAGGHGRSGTSVHDLLPAMVTAAGNVPVLAAGGLTSGVDLAWAWEVGAAGIVVGTRFYATPEALDIPAAKERLIAASNTDTLRTSVFDVTRGPEWPTGYDGRAIRNDTTDRWHHRLDELRGAVGQEREAYAEAAARGDISRRVVWAGTGVDSITGLVPAADLVRRIAAEAETARR